MTEAAASGALGSSGELDDFRSTELPEETEVLVIGGGIAGTSTAYHIAAAGIPVTLVESDRIGGGTTASAVGILSPPLRQPYHETVHDLGEALARRIWQFGLGSVARLGELLRSRGEETATELDLSGGYLLAEPHTDYLVQGSFKALEAAGMPVEWIPGAAIRELLAGHGFTGGYKLHGGGALDPQATARAVARAARDAGAVVVEGLRVTDVDHRRTGLVSQVGGRELTSRRVVYATHVQATNSLPELRGKIVPVRGQGFATGVVRQRFEGAFATHWKLNAWRQRADGRLLVSGWRYDAGRRLFDHSFPKVDEELQGQLSSWFETAFPRIGHLTVERRWSGVFGWTPDYLPLVGHLPDRPDELVIAGFSGGGLPFAFGCGDLITAILTAEHRPPEAALFAPERFS